MSESAEPGREPPKASPKDRAIARALRLLAGRVVFREEADVEAFTEAVDAIAPVEPPEPA